MRTTEQIHAGWSRAVLAVSAMLLVLSCTPRAHRFEGSTMGTRYRVTIDGEVPVGLERQVRARLDELEQVFSNWRGDSAVSQWNASRSTDWQPVPGAVAEVVSMALQCARDTDGALDVTIAPLIDLWGFGPLNPKHLPPDEDEIRAAMQHCGWQMLEVRLDPPMLRKSDPLLTINLSTLVEGYASDAVADLIQSRGCERVLVDVGGAINARGKVWNVGVQEPGSLTGEVISAVPLRDQAVTTAGTYRQHFERDGHDYSHIIDPRTGRPVSHDLVSVSVLAKRALVADGYDTGLLVLGPERGHEVATKLGLKTVFVRAE